MFWEDWRFTKLMKVGITWHLDYLTLEAAPLRPSVIDNSVTLVVDLAEYVP